MILELLPVPSVRSEHSLVMRAGPDTIGKLLQQRRRWNNSTFVNILMMAINWRLYLQLKTLPIMM